MKSPQARGAGRLELGEVGLTGVGPKPEVARIAENQARHNRCSWRVINLGFALKNAARIERQILDYLTENPRARDTLRGIVEWWLLKQNIARAKAQVEAALARLVAQGKVRAKTAPDGQVLYGLGPGSLPAGRPHSEQC